MIEHEPLSSDLTYGAIVRGITLEKLGSEDNRRHLRQLWYRHGLLVFRDNAVTNELHLELSKVFGELEGHFLKDRIVAGHPELVSFSSDPHKDMTMEVDGRVLVGYIPWHTDFRWMAHPNHGGILRVHEQPVAGGDTGFACMIDAYNRLTDALKARVEGLEAVHKMQTDDRMFKYYTHEKLRIVKDGSSFEAVRARSPTDFPAVAHPLVRTQPETNRKMLYFTPHNAVTILGLETEKAEELLRELASIATDPTFAYYHHWEPDDLVLWDNLRMQHAAMGVPLGEGREVRRTTISAPFPTGRTLESGGWKWEDNRPETQET
jgi:taurine dioxygenase